MTQQTSSQTSVIATQTTSSKTSVSSLSLQDRLLEALAPLVESEGYELVHLEVQTHRAKTIRIFIDHLQGDDAIGVEDCAKVSRALDSPLDQLTETETLLAGGYELEVSSPGVDRPLRKPADFERFKEREVRLHVFRPLTAEELQNEDYARRNPKQKNFLGVLQGMKDDSVLLSIPASMGSTRKGAKKGKAARKTEEKHDLVTIPHSLISKANIEPDFDAFNDRSEDS